ncbi:MAG: exported protein of unknown function [Candidatus Saccharibacteria bacterium]|nr:exported protein of unknown function [Candidatus Saccharibacteria bacterium]
MNRSLVTSVCIAVSLLGGVLFGVVAKAEDTLPMTDEHIARIRANCVDAQSTLFQLHASDAGLRVNRGQIYESMSTKLMAPFNSRIVLNRISDESLLTTAAQYDQQLAAFRQQYQQYEEAMSKTLDFDCVAQPVAFYDSVTDTRAKRQLTHATVVELHKTIQKYGSEIDIYAKNFQADKQ